MRIPLHLVHTILLLAGAAVCDGDSDAATTCATCAPAAPSTAPSPPLHARGNTNTTSRTPRRTLDLWSIFDTPSECAPSDAPRPPPAPEPEEAFESFEEWKRRQEARTNVSASDVRVVDDEPANVSRSAGDVPPSESPPADAPATNNSGANQPPAQLAPPPPPRHRYNYASPDCSARVLASSASTQHASSLLHKSRDRYMLTPCRAEHWVVVELCDEIRIEAVELAVWEFFSGIVRGVVVKVGEDAGGSTGWTTVGEFVGKNVRGVQTFALPEPTSFHRFLRLDFPSFYGSEYYCPVSQLKVYGMNQMEAFKMEQRRAAEARGAEDEAARERERDRQREAEREREVLRAAEVAAAAERERREREDDERQQRELCELERLVQEQAKRMGRVEIFAETPIECVSVPRESATTTTAALVAASPSVLDVTVRSGTDDSSAPDTSGSGVGVSAGSTDSAPGSDSASNSGSGSPGSGSPGSGTGTPVSSSSGSSAPGSSPGTLAGTLDSASGTPPGTGSDTSPTHAVASSATYTRAAGAPRSDSSESIYAFIIRRLNALEGNSTLVARYIDEQAKALRSALARAEGRWEASASRAADDAAARWDAERLRQEERLGRVLSQMEYLRAAVEGERRATAAQLRVLADELGFERRRSIVQLVVLIVMIVLGVLSRSDTIDALLGPLADVRRRRDPPTNARQKRLSTGPLAGLVIDLPPPSPATLGPRSPRSPRARAAKRRSATPTLHGTHTTAYAPTATPYAARKRNTPASRSFSAGITDPTAVLADLDDEPRHHRAPRRRLARSSHLHAMRRMPESDNDERDRDREQRERERERERALRDGESARVRVGTAETGAGAGTHPAYTHTARPPPSRTPGGTSSPTHDSEWGTESADTASASEIDEAEWTWRHSVRFDDESERSELEIRHVGRGPARAQAQAQAHAHAHTRAQAQIQPQPQAQPQARAQVGAETQTQAPDWSRRVAREWERDRDWPQWSERKDDGRGLRLTTADASADMSTDADVSAYNEDSDSERREMTPVGPPADFGHFGMFALAGGGQGVRGGENGNGEGDLGNQGGENGENGEGDGGEGNGDGETGEGGLNGQSGEGGEVGEIRQHVAVRVEGTAT